MTNINFDGVPYLEDNPFLFPCLIAVVINVLSFFSVLFLLPETNKPGARAAKKNEPKEVEKSQVCCLLNIIGPVFCSL